MIGLAARLIGGMISPLVDQLSSTTARLLRKLALFIAAGICLLVVLIAVTIAFDLWVASKAGAIAGVLSVAGVYLAAGGLALFFALKPPPSVARADNVTSGSENISPDARAGHESQIDDFAAPLLDILQRLGLRREQLAVLAGASVAKQIGPLPLVGLAIVAGFLIGRLGGRWRDIVPTELIGRLLGSGLFESVFGGKPDVPDDADIRDAA